MLLIDVCAVIVAFVSVFCLLCVFVFVVVVLELCLALLWLS